VLEQTDPRIPNRHIDALWHDVDALDGICNQWGPPRRITQRRTDLGRVEPRGRMWQPIALAPHFLDRDAQFLGLLHHVPDRGAGDPEPVRDLLAGQSHLDIIVIGDSNATFSAGGSRGFAGGFVDELTRRGVPSYGTGLFPAACSGRDVAYPLMGTRGFTTSSQASISVNDSRRDCDGWKPGAASGIELPGLFERSRHAPLQLEGRDIDWAYLPEGTIVNDNSRDWISLGSRGGAAEFGSECAGAYRMVIARMQASDPTSERTPLRLRVTRDFAYGESVDDGICWISISAFSTYRST
jgi:hypothetical protein